MKRAKSKKVGDPFDTDTEQGPQARLTFWAWQPCLKVAWYSKSPFCEDATILSISFQACMCLFNAILYLSLHRVIHYYSLERVHIPYSIQGENHSASWQVSEEQFNKILEMINIGKEQGAKLETGGGRVGDKGYYIEPTVFSDVKGQPHELPFSMGLLTFSLCGLALSSCSCY